MIRKGRRVAPSVKNRVRGDRHWTQLEPEKRLQGERHWGARLTDQDIRNIRADTRPGVEIALAYGIVPTHISKIRRGLVWRHVR